MAVEVGTYNDFHVLRQPMADELEGGAWGSRFPVLMTHPDGGGRRSPTEARQLARELLVIADEFARLPARALNDFQAMVANANGLNPHSLLETFMDLEGGVDHRGHDSAVRDGATPG